MKIMAAPRHQDGVSGWTAQTVSMGSDILDRMERAVAKVHERLLRATSALNGAAVPYAVVGGNAVASWVATIDEGAVRNTRDVDLLVRRSDLPVITATLEGAGFVRDVVLDVVMFRDGDQGKSSEAVRLLFAGEKTRPDHLGPAPEIRTVMDAANFQVIALDALIEMKLTSNRDIDQTHVRDLIGVGLIDRTWLPKLPPELADRLKQILDTPNSWILDAITGMPPSFSRPLRAWPGGERFVPRTRARITFCSPPGSPRWKRGSCPTGTLAPPRQAGWGPAF